MSSDHIPAVAGVKHDFVDAGALRMHVAEAGAGEPVLMLHGWPQHWYLWRAVIPRLAPHARVICPDLRGFGWTAAPAGGYDKETMTRDVVALLDALGIERVRVVGHDWGGWIGFLLGIAHPHRVDRLLACNIVPPWPARSARAALAMWRLSYQVAISAPRAGGAIGRRLAELGLRGSRALDDAEIAAFTDRLRGERSHATELLYRTFLLRELAPVALGRYSARDYRVPTLLVFGDGDPVIPVWAVEKAVAASDVVDLEVVPGAGHFVVDERPDVVADRARTFLRLG